MEEISARTQMAKIRNFEKGYMATLLISLGAKLGIFQALNETEEGMTIADLATKLEAHQPYLKIWCQTAYHFEILDCDNQGRFKLQPFLDEILADTTHFRNYLDNIALDVDVIGAKWKDAPDIYRTGEKLEMYGPELFELGCEPTRNIPLAFLFMIFPKQENIKHMLDQGVRFLDIGCGMGHLITQLAQSFENSTFVGVDPNVYGIERAKKKISEFGLEKQVSAERIGAENLNYDNEFDIVSMVVTLHEIPPDVRPKAVEKAYHALKSGGYILILDFPYPSKIEDFRDPMYDMGIFDQFYESVCGVAHLNQQEQIEMLTEVGFKDIQTMSIGKGMFEFVTATK